MEIPNITHQIKLISGRKKLKSIKLWNKNAQEAQINPAILVLSGDSLSVFKLDFRIAVIRQRNEIIPNIPVSAHICK